MNSVWQSLLWKEWREHRWKLATLVAIFVLVPVISSLRRPEAVFGFVSALFFLAIPLASMFVAMNIAAGEQTRRTIGFLQSLPMPMSRPATAKLLWGMITVITPVLLAVAAAWIWSSLGNRGDVAEAIYFDKSVYKTSWLIDDWFAARAVGGVLAAVSILLWMAAGGVNRSDEVRAAAVGLLVTLGVWLALLFLPLVLTATNTLSYWWHLLAVAAAGGPVMSQPDVLTTTIGQSYAAAVAPFAVVAAVSHLTLGAWYIRRFGRRTPGRDTPLEAPSTVTEKRWLAPPRRRPLTAILWKQARDSAPLAGMVAVITMLTAVLIAAYAQWRQPGSAIEALISTSFAAWAAVGLFVSVVAGIAVFHDDLEPRLHAFWRSRPVNVNQWFVVKFLAGLLIPLIILPLPLLASLGVALMTGTELPDDSGEAAQVAAGFAAAHIGVYCTAVLMIVLVRQAAYAAILTIGAAGLSMAALEFSAPGITKVGVISLAVCAMVAVTILAWAALKNDWGWKH